MGDGADQAREVEELHEMDEAFRDAEEVEAVEAADRQAEAEATEEATQGPSGSLRASGEATRSASASKRLRTAQNPSEACPVEETTVGRALRAIQVYDERASLASTRHLLIRAEDLLGEHLGLECTGVVDGRNDDGTAAYYDHSGGTCPIHEWLVPSDHPGVPG